MYRYGTAVVVDTVAYAQVRGDRRGGDVSYMHVLVSLFNVPMHFFIETTQNTGEHMMSDSARALRTRSENTVHA